MIKSTKKFIHLDMDAFFAAVEQRDNPELRGKAVIVGGDPDRRGVVSTCSYEARKFGVHSAMPSGQAKRLCPHGIFIHGRMEVYQEESQRIRQVMHEFTDLVEPLSIDEAFLDVTTNKINCPSATWLARMLKQRIHEVTGLTASAGVSYNMFLAKVASDINKPNGLTVITPDDALDFLEKLPIKKFYGIGRVTAAKLERREIFTGADLKKLSLLESVKLFGKNGKYYYDIVRGRDSRELETNWIRKSLGREITYEHDLKDLNEIADQAREISFTVADELNNKQLKGKTITLKLRYENFQTITRSRSLPDFTAERDIIAATALDLLRRKTEAGKRAIRLLGVSVTNFPTSKPKNAWVQMEFPF